MGTYLSWVKSWLLPHAILHNIPLCPSRTMQCCGVLHHTRLHHSPLPYTVPYRHNTASCSAVLHHTALRFTSLYQTTIYYTLLFSTKLY